ncbi:MAG: ACP S-malonyltransferase [Spongiibacteraceae bacterium]|jgi:[acyl-carrier-protein] S-malonyltransferase|nr:ACP S-malonyltransferase [Spongiibacteraceae bacterium]
MADARLALVFPGQGSQKVGMLGGLAARFAIIGETFAEASDALGYDLWQLAQEGPQEALNLTEKTQPLLLAASVALWRVWQQQGGATPSLLAGHSLGEFSALVCSGVIGFADAVQLVRSRGQFMQTAVPVGQGTMAAVLGLDDARIIDICAAHSSGNDVVEAVNFNSPGQVVIAGTTAAVERAAEACKEAGARRAMLLPVSAPFHTSLMRPAGDKLRDAMAAISFNAPQIPVVHNVHGRTESDPQRIRELLFEQIFSAVKWTSCVEYMVTQGVTTTVECGPGKVLSGLNKRIDKSLTCLSIEDEAGLEQALASL